MTPRDDTQANDMTQPRTDNLDDHHRQQLSAMLDGELQPDQAKFMLRRLEHDGELAACWERWQVCGEVMRGRQGALLPADFSRRVASAILEQGDGAPAAGAAAPAAPKHPRWARWGGGAPLAASVAMGARHGGRQAPAPGPSPVAPTQVVASTASAGADAQAAPSPEPAAPAPTQAPDAASTLATAVAAAEVPRRAAQRRAARGQQQRAASRVRRSVQAPVAVAAASAAPDSLPSPGADLASAPSVLAEADSPASGTVTDLFTAQPMQPRPWPRAILPDLPARGAFTVGYGGMAREQHPFHPFEPRVELQQAPAGRQPAASGPR